MIVSFHQLSRFALPTETCRDSIDPIRLYTANTPLSDVLYNAKISEILYAEAIELSEHCPLDAPNDFQSFTHK